jgi:hypothetical protein
LREEKISYNVVKNTMMKLAAKGTDLEKLNDYFEGPTAVAISYGDPIPLAKILTEFQKTLPSLEIRAVLVEGRVTPPSEVKSLASMPPREVIFAQVLGGIQTPAGQLAGAPSNRCSGHSRPERTSWLHRQRPKATSKGSLRCAETRHQATRGVFYRESTSIVVRLIL